MGSSRFFYDDCRSATRLSREYTQIVGADNFSVERQSDIGKYAYTVTRVGGSASLIWFIKSLKSMDGFEAIYLFKKNCAAQPSYSNVGILFDCLDASNYSQVSKSDMLYIGRRVSGVFYYKYLNISLTNNVWYNMKVRKDHNNVKAKYWLLGTSEPDWIFTQETAPSGSNENPVRLQYKGGTMGLDVFLESVGDWAKIADIRITPVRRTGP